MPVLSIRQSIGAIAMKAKALILFLLGILTAQPGCSRQSQADTPSPNPCAIEQLGWISGSWEMLTPDARREEHWTDPGGGILLGVGRVVTKRKTFFEFLRIEARADGVYYVAQEQGKSPGVDFKLARCEGPEAVFENPAHDFPQRLIYRKNPDGSLFARIEGPRDGKTVGEDFLFKPRNEIVRFPASAVQEQVSFTTEDGGFVYADLYGTGDRGVVLAHGGRFNKASWEKQARTFAEAGFRVVAIDFRGYGQSKGPGQAKPLSAPLHWDVLAAVRYLRRTGAKSVAVVGGSMGGGAAADASIQAPGEIDRLVLLGAEAGTGRVGPPEKLKGRKLFIVARDDTRGDGVVRLVKIREQYEKAPEPKELVILDGSAHAQFIFEAEQGEQLMREILRFLSEP